MNEPTDEQDKRADVPDDAARASKETVTNDAVAGETVMEGAGEGNDGPTGGAPRELSPEYAENDLSDEEIDLGDGTIAP